LSPLSVVIPVYNNWWLTQRCLRALEGLRGDAATLLETIVVDNASTDETAEAIGGFHWVRYLRLESNRNFAGACNAGARLAEAPLVLFLNNDAYPLGDALDPLVRVFERDEVAIAGGALFFEDGVTQAAGLVVLPNAHWHYSQRNLPPELEGVTMPRDALGVSGAAMAVRTEWFLANGGFDESFVNGFEDVDLCLRARQAGRAIAYVANARFAHYEGASAGRFDREAENERHFYRRWSPSFASMPRVARGEVGAIVVRASADIGPLPAAALEDLEQALRSFGHPIVRAIRPWRRFDRRFRRAASLGWFVDDVHPPGITIDGAGALARIRTHGAAALEVPWLPCAASERIARLAIRRSEDPSCRIVALAGSDAQAIDAQSAFDGFEVVPVTAPMLLGDAQIREVACVVHLGLTDESAFGNVMLAQAGLPAVVLARAELSALFAPDVAFIAQRDEIAQGVGQLVADPAARLRYGTLVAADAQRRFSPRRSAIRVVDLLCAARFGLERPAAARTDTPVAASAGSLNR
jgi:GT2 family glycosyltransferase